MRLSLSEHGSRVFPGACLTPADRRLLADGALDGMLRVRESAGGGLEVEATAYVGVVRLEACEIRVLPKYLGGGLDVLRMLDYAAGGTGRLLSSEQDLTAGDPDLRDLVALMVTEHGERLLRHGVRRDYLTREDDLPVVRGRLLADRQILRHHGRLDRLACRFDEHDADVPDNRLCAAALERVARTARPDGLRARARRAAAQFAALAPTPLGDLRAVVAGLEYHRHNAHYRSAHRWAELLLSGGGLDGLFGAGPLASRAFLVDMNGLFEDFVTRLLQEGAAGSGLGLRVDAQARHRRVLFDERARSPYSEVRPDVLILGERDGRPFRLPVDAKYKLYDRKKLSTADLYQAFLYAHALGTPAACVLVHPGGPEATGARVAVRDWDGATSARVRSVAVDLRWLLGRLAGPEPSGAAARVWADVLDQPP
ncbi:McrC family protein [Streptomyces sp. NPDC058157]|uniref:McrC family protein n=1 Tax=Streptomyces sp. NPDC058157 TaxID=3346360 RepID=UPI0036ECA387